MIIMKFGGSSVKNAERISNVANIIKMNLGKKPVVVLSAMGGITDKLIDSSRLAAEGKDYSKLLKEIEEQHYTAIKELGLYNAIVEELIKEFTELLKQISQDQILTDEVLDKVQSYGERMSTRMMAAHLNKIGIEAKQFDAWDIGMTTDSEFGKAEPLDDVPDKIKAHLSKLNEVPVITGFIGKDTAGTITTLGRGGSDYSAAIVGAAIDCEDIQIWTDVDGIMTSDPRIVLTAKTIPKISFAEASELAFFGAKVLHPKTILPAMQKAIPVSVLNTYNPSGKGTTILRKATESKEIIKAIAVKKNVSLVNISSTRMLDAHGFLARIFDVFGDYRKSVDMVSTSEVSVSLTVDNEKDLGGIVEELKEIAEVEISSGKAIVCVVGHGMRKAPGIAGRMFTALGNNKINIVMISQGASEINIGLVVDVKDAEKSMQVLHKEYFG